MKPLVVLTGPTAVGKTSLSIKLAKEINAEIISADSMQVYKGMDIGSAKITKDEMSGIIHYLIDEYEITDEFNVTEFQKAAKDAIGKIYAKGKIPLIVGGTGFYIQSILKDVDFTETTNDDEYRNELYKLAGEKGPEYVHEMLKEVDPEAANEIHANNVKRVVRALEFYKFTGEKISNHNETQKANPSPYNYAYFVLTRERESLYENIDRRVDIMMDAGLLDEVRSLKDAGAKRDMISMQGLGYKELLAYLDGETTLDEAVYLIKRNTRHFAKRQLTWFKRETNVSYIEVDKQSEMESLNSIIHLLKEKGIVNE